MSGNEKDFSSVPDSVHQDNGIYEKDQVLDLSYPRNRPTRRQILLIILACGCTLLAWTFTRSNLSPTFGFIPTCNSDSLLPDNYHLSLNKRVDKILKSTPLIGK